MPQPMSSKVPSRLRTLVTSTIEFNVALSDKIKSFQFPARQVRGTLRQLDELKGVLGALNETISATTEAESSVLEAILQRCGNACNEFGEELMKHVSPTAGRLTSSQGWARVRYMDESTDWFGNLLDGYKSAISVTLAVAYFRKSAGLIANLTNPKTLVKEAMDDFGYHLEYINRKLESLERTPAALDSVVTKRQLREEKLSTEKSLEICAQLTDHISRIELLPKGGGSSPKYINPEDLHQTAPHVSKLENSSVGNGIQYLVSTDHRLIEGKNDGFGWTRQVAGYMDPASLQGINNFMATASHQDTGNDPKKKSDRGAKNEKFQTLYGRGLVTG